MLDSPSQPARSAHESAHAVKGRAGRREGGVSPWKPIARSSIAGRILDRFTDDAEELWVGDVPRAVESGVAAGADHYAAFGLDASRSFESW